MQNSHVVKSICVYVYVLQQMTRPRNIIVFYHGVPPLFRRRKASQYASAIRVAALTRLNTLIDIFIYYALYITSPRQRVHLNASISNRRIAIFKCNLTISTVIIFNDLTIDNDNAQNA